MDNYIFVFQEAVKSWNEVIAIVTTIAVGHLSYEALLYNIITFDPQNANDFKSSFYI